MLRQRLRSIVLPPVKTINVDGREIRLPVPSQGPERSPTQEELEYLVGFFTGDGCVTMNRNTGEVRLQMNQNVDSVDVLMHFRRLLGGGVYREKTATGTTKQVVRWQVTGSKMTCAAAILSKFPSMKQEQLLIAAQGNVPQENRTRVKGELQRMKNGDYVPQQLPECSWSFFAGFFDAEGSIGVQAHAASCQLKLQQNNPCALLRLLDFLNRNDLHS